MPEEPIGATATAPAAPAAETQTNGSPAAPAPKSAPAKQPQSPTVTPEGAGETPSVVNDQGKKPSKGVEQAFFKLREDKRTAKEQLDAQVAKNAELERQLTEARPAQNQPAEKTGTAPSLLDDPDAWAANKEREIEGNIFKRLEERGRVEVFAKDAATSEQWLLTRSHLRDPQFAEDVRHILQNNPDYQGVKPSIAARAAYHAVCEMRGVVPHMDKADPAGSRASSAKGSAGFTPSSQATSSGPKTWTKAEARAYLRAIPPGAPGSRERLLEVQTAEREGRVKG